MPMRHGNSTVGRPSITAALWNKAVAMYANGASAADVMRELGIKATKAYEIRRSPILKQDTPAPDTSAGH